MRQQAGVGLLHTDVIVRVGEQRIEERGEGIASPDPVADQPRRRHGRRRDDEPEDAPPVTNGTPAGSDSPDNKEDRKQAEEGGRVLHSAAKSAQ